ncbi:iron complex transport system ATP-binding protein [Brevibacterium paucivorans]|uniref:Iron complex transport system ATP-binding protein n=1 Tax=Brevibacterium paucivorans TaxID=170994 RepID=A0ABS2SGS7_9MICO|nr:ABC transporter ATP-binding protein [Brevibacterium paucivorans]MBM7815451.1 iron complex transport system ATP-binding protein [Brevibacterium paucivorans]
MTTGGASTMKTGVTLENLSVSYGKRTVLSGVSATFAPGHVHGIIGPNGAGKSTLLHAILGVRAYTGSVRVDGAEVADLSARERAQRIAFVAQDAPPPDDFTGRELVAMGRYVRQGRFSVKSAHDVEVIDAALEQVGATGWADRPVHQTSGGERQLTSLARAIAQEAPTLVLDEPTSALDLSHEQRVLRLLRPWARGDRTVIAVLHDITQAARYCDELVLLAPTSAGSQVVAQGPPEVVLTPAFLESAYGVKVDVRRSEVTDTLTVTPLD